jgi:hypothetical protein
MERPSLLDLSWVRLVLSEMLCIASRMPFSHFAKELHKRGLLDVEHAPLPQSFGTGAYLVAIPAVILGKETFGRAEFSARRAHVIALLVVEVKYRSHCGLLCKISTCHLFLFAFLNAIMNQLVVITKSQSSCILFYYGYPIFVIQLQNNPEASLVCPCAALDRGRPDGVRPVERCRRSNGG